ARRSPPVTVGGRGIPSGAPARWTVPSQDVVWRRSGCRRQGFLAYAMDTGSFATVLHTLFGEVVRGSPDPRARTYLLNRGDAGLPRSWERIAAAAASATHDGGGSIAAHVDHLRYGLSLLNRWATGAPPPWEGMDWTASWRKGVVSDMEWQKLRDELRREAEVW